MDHGTTLHVAAMPFPTVQGTQACIRAMLDVLAGVGRDVHLVTYARSGYAIAPSYRIHRTADFPADRSLRSGPSMRKIALDVQLARAVRRVATEIALTVVVAHHVEAATACIAAGVAPLVYFAHTALAPELPTYMPRLPARALEAAGRGLERMIARRAHAIAAISPALAARMQDDLGASATFVPTPWPVPVALGSADRELARQALGVPRDADVLLYAGNLDAYQGWEAVLDALALVVPHRPRARLAIATTSDTRVVREAAGRRGLDGRVFHLALDDERDRRAAHAVADVAVVPRRVAGGLPIKLLDAMARGVPAVTTSRAAAGLDLAAAALVVRDDDADALAAAVRLVLSTPSAREQLGEHARAYVLRAHSPERFVEALDVVARTAIAAAGRVRVTVR